MHHHTNTIHLINQGDYYRIDYDSQGEVRLVVRMPQHVNQKGNPVEWEDLQPELQERITYRIFEEMTTL